MALLSSEIQRLKYELGYHNINIDGQVYVGYTVMFETVVAAYLSAGAKTTSTTYVPDPSGAPTLATLTLASPTGFSAGDSIWLDVDARQERATVESITGSVVSLYATKPHGILAGTSPYSVTVEGGEAIVRELLSNIRAARDQMRVTSTNASMLGSTGGLKRVDEIEFYGSGMFVNLNPAGGALFSNLNDQIAYWRNELASVLGVANLWEQKRGGGGSIALY